MSFAVTSNVKRFTASLRAVQAATKRDEAEIVTRACRNVAFRAAQFTPTTTAAKIRRDLRADNLLAKLASRNLKRTKGRFTREEHQQEMYRIERKRTNGARALRAGWANAVTDLGGSFRGAKMKPGGSAAKGFGKKASIFNLTAKIRNAIVTENAHGTKTDAANILVLVSALNRAVEFVAFSEEQYAKRKIEQTLRKYSD